MNLFPLGYEKRVLASVDSTLSEAARIAPELAGPTWILAHEQTAARGRRGRSWTMPIGNFAATLVLQPKGDASSAALRSFVASLALFDAMVASGVSNQDLALKWPNDVLLKGGKVAGILLETAGIVSHLAIGIGVNLIEAPHASEVEAGAVPPIALAQAVSPPTPDVFLYHLATAYAHYEAQYTQLGFAPIRTAWLARAARLGETITARTTRDETVGVFRDIDEQGQLVLETPKGRVAIPAADVFF